MQSSGPQAMERDKVITAPDGALRIFKGASADSLEPFTIIHIGDEVVKLEGLRKLLDTDMEHSDKFLTTDHFPVPRHREPHIDWSHILQPMIRDANTQAEEPQPHRKPSGVEGTATVAILSTGSRPSFPPPILGDAFYARKSLARRFQGQPGQPQDADPYGGVTTPNAKMLTNDQAKALFEINSLFSGLWLNHDSHPRAFSTLFSIHDNHPYTEMIQLADASTTETKTTLSKRETKLLKQGFEGVKAEMKTPWVSGSYGESQSNDSGESGSKSRSYCTSIYRYPRAIIRIDLDTLDVSPSFLKEKSEAFGKADHERKLALFKLFEKYGHVFATHVELGGMLHSTKIDLMDEKGKHSSAESTVSATLSAQIQAFSPSASLELRDKTSTEGKKVDSSEALAVEAVGGDTTLASNPVAWSPTVIPFVNWRATRFSGITLLTDIPKLFTAEEKAQIEKLFVRKLLGFYSSKGQPDDWFLGGLRRPDGSRLYIKASPFDPDPESIFSRPASVNLVGKKGPDDLQWKLYELIPGDVDEYAAISLVQTLNDTPPRITPVLTCINKRFLKQVPYLDWVMGLLPCQLDDPFQKSWTMENARGWFSLDHEKGLKNGVWQINMDMVEVVTEEEALGG